MGLSPELEAFIRYLAMNPHKLEEYKGNPSAFLDAANLGDEARASLDAWGPASVAKGVQKKAEEIYADPASAQAASYGRDETVRGFGARS